MLFSHKRKPHEIVELLRLGKTEVINDFYVSGYKAVKKHVLKNNGDEDLAKDIYQDSIIVLLENIKKPNFELSTDIEGYLLGVAKNLLLSYHRKEKIADGKLMQMNFLYTILNDEEIEWMEKASEYLSHFLQTIGSPCFEILEQFYFQKLSMKQIAANLNYSSEDTAKTTKNRCMTKLKDLMNTKPF
jgi:RNA polymerase sigma factor (sigma-70 family)